MGHDKIMISILFVDDEPAILRALKRVLHKEQDAWRMFFARSGSQALEIIAAEDITVLVTDIQMPGMSGTELLLRVIREHPHIVRIILSGHPDLDPVFSSTLAAQLVLAKPFSRDQLLEVIQQGISIAEMLDPGAVSRIREAIQDLPPLPKIYLDILAETGVGSPCRRQIGAVIDQDPGISARVLERANQIRPNQDKAIASTEQAIFLLGMNEVKALLLFEHLKDEQGLRTMFGAQLHGIRRHSVATAELARRIAIAEDAPVDVQEQCHVAGLLHDVGKCLLIYRCPEMYMAVLRETRARGGPISRRELEIIGVTHAEVGAYLLRQWGMPRKVLEAVAFHHAPHRLEAGFRPLVAVHAANYFEHRNHRPNPEYARPDLDMAFLEHQGMTAGLKQWEELSKK
jgi:putative nucleotidyltransferase with HDIG domain